MLGEKRNLLKAQWPKYDPVLAKEEEIEIPVQINGKVAESCSGSGRRVRGIILERALADEKIKTTIAGKQIVKKIVVPGKLVNIVVK